MKTKTIKIRKDRDIAKCQKIDEILYLAELMDYEKDLSPHAFEGSTGLYYVVCGDKTRIIGERAFANCKNLLRFDGLPQVVAKEAFSFCSNLKSFNFSTLHSLSPSAFSYSGLINIDIPSKIKSIPNNCFMACVDLKHANFNEVEQIEDEAFQSTGLKYIKIQNSLESIGKRAFEGCLYLSDIFVERILPPKIYSSTFYGCYIRNIYFYSKIQYDFFIRDKNWSKYQDTFKIISPKDAKQIITKLDNQQDNLWKCM